MTIRKSNGRSSISSYPAGCNCRKLKCYIAAGKCTRTLKRDGCGGSVTLDRICGYREYPWCGIDSDSHTYRCSITAACRTNRCYSIGNALGLIRRVDEHI